MDKVDPVVKIPALFIVGEKDLVIAGMDREQLEQRMRPVVPHLRHIEWLEGAGHWIQQERPQECNRVPYAATRYPIVRLPRLLRKLCVIIRYWK